MANATTPHPATWHSQYLEFAFVIAGKLTNDFLVRPGKYTSGR